MLNIVAKNGYLSKIVLENSITENMLLNLYKKMGETPLECINRFRAGHSEYADAKMSYAGRLDPLAEGVLLVMVGDDMNKRREEYLQLPKTYSFDIVFGVATDTFDLLGLVTKTFFDSKHSSQLSLELPEKNKLEKLVSSLKGKLAQEYPPFSSKTVGGKALFSWAKENRLHEIEIPKNDIEIYSVELLSAGQLSGTELLHKATQATQLVRGDFRQDKIKKSWNENLKGKEAATFPFISLKISCSSGTYVRALSQLLGQKVALPAVAMNIVREAVGEHLLKESL